MTVKKNEKKILDFIREGRNTLADFTDNLGISAAEVNKIAEEMENNGYIVKEDYTGISSFNFLLTDKGVEELSQLSEEEKDLLTTEGINMNQFKVLTHLLGKEDIVAATVAQELEIPPMELISDLCYLVNKGLIRESGLLRRKIEILPKGSELVERRRAKIHSL